MKAASERLLLTLGATSSNITRVVVPMSEEQEVIYLDVSYEATFFITSRVPATPETPDSIPATAPPLYYID